MGVEEACAGAIERHPSPDGVAIVAVAISHAIGDIHEAAPLRVPRLIDARDGRILLDLWWPVCAVDWAWDGEGTLELRFDGIVARVPPTRDVFATNVDDWVAHPIADGRRQLEHLARTCRLHDAPDGSLRILCLVHEHAQGVYAFALRRPALIDRRTGAVLLDLRDRNVDLGQVDWPAEGGVRMVVKPGDAAFLVEPGARAFRIDDGAPRPIGEMPAAARRRLGRGYGIGTRVPTPWLDTPPSRGLLNRAQRLGLLLVLLALAATALLPWIARIGN